MRRRMTLGLSLACFLVLMAGIPAGAATKTGGGPDKDNNKIFDDLDRVIKDRQASDRVEVIALFSEASSDQAVDDASRAVGNFRTIYEYDNLSGVVAEMTVGQVRSLAARAGTVQIQHNSQIDFSLDTARAAFGVDKAVAEFGHDGNNEQSLTCPGARQYCKDDVVIAILDTGIYWGHQDLDGGKVIASQDCASGDCMNLSGVDTNGHGTHVASIAAGDGDANPAHRGVAPGAALVNVRVGSGFSTTIGALDAGIEWTIANQELYGIDVMNMSLNGSNPSNGTESTARLANLAAAAGILPVASAGNRGPDNGTTSYPGAAKYALQVGNMADPLDLDHAYPAGFSLTWSSGRGPTLDGRVKPDVVAPGTDIIAASLSANEYVTRGGTSMASPFAAGAAALALDANPTLGTRGTACDPADTSAECADGVIDSTMDTSLKNALTSTAVDFGTPGPDNDYGHGRLDVYAAIDAASPQEGTGGPSLPAHTHFDGILSGSGATSDHQIVVTDTSAPIAATLLWNRAAGITTPDFDLALLDPSGSQVVTEGLSNNWRHEVMDFVPTVTGTYTVRVKSVSGAGTYGLDVSFPGTPPAPPTTPPDTPTGVNAVARSGSQIDVSWSDVSQESGYKVERSPNGTDGWAVVGTPAANVTSFSDVGLSGSTTYYYRVTASNEIGDSAPSNVVSARTLGIPAAPATLAATARSTTQIDLNWSNVSEENGYKVQRSTASTGPWSQIGTTAANVTIFANTGLVNNTTYYYRVIAYNSVGDSPPSPIASAKTGDVTAPSVPTGLRTTPARGKVTLNWNVSTDSGGSGLAGYKVWRATAAAGPFTMIATTTKATYANTGLLKGKTYWYYVTAYDKAGNTSAPSATVTGVPT